MAPFEVVRRCRGCQELQRGMIGGLPVCLVYTDLAWFARVFCGLRVCKQEIDKRLAKPGG